MEEKLTQEDVDLIREIIIHWQNVSFDRTDFSSMTDHCHVEVEMAEALALKIERFIEV